MSSILQWIGWAIVSFVTLIFWLIWFVVKFVAGIITLAMLFLFVYLFFGGFSSKNRNFGSVFIKGQTIEYFSNVGKADLENVFIEGTLKVYGKFRGKDLRIKDDASVYGKASIYSSEFARDIVIYGKLDLENSTVNGRVTVNGKADFSECTLSDLSIYSKKIKLRSCKVKNIYVKDHKHERRHYRGCSCGEQVVRLIGTEVSGDIVFDCGCGRVILEAGSVVHGKIVGGKVE